MKNFAKPSEFCSSRKIDLTCQELKLIDKTVLKSILSVFKSIFPRIVNMKVSELRQKSKEELKNMLEDTRKRASELRFIMRQGKKVKNVKEVRGLKKDIARILTLLNRC